MLNKDQQCNSYTVWFHRSPPSSPPQFPGGHTCQLATQKKKGTKSLFNHSVTNTTQPCRGKDYISEVFFYEEKVWGIQITASQQTNKSPTKTFYPALLNSANHFNHVSYKEQTSSFIKFHALCKFASRQLTLLTILLSII